MGCRQSQSNLAKHGVSFKSARCVFDDVFAFERYDFDSGPSEVEYSITGMVNDVILMVVYTEPGERTRIISARKATKHEQTTIAAKRLSDGALVQVLPDGSIPPNRLKTKRIGRDCAQ